MALAGFVGGAQAAPIVPGAGWTVLDQFAAAPFFFVGPDGSPRWTLDCPSDCKLLVTDLFVVSDLFRIIIDGTDHFSTVVPDWPVFGDTDPKSAISHYTEDPDVAWADPAFSHFSIHVGAGLHVIEFEDIHIPPVAIGGGPFPDGTIAFRAVIPEPATLALIGLAFAGLGFARRRNA
jgi:hypothetical protein